MKIKITLLAAAFLFFGSLAKAQQKTALHHNGVTTIFSGSAQFTNAYNAAVIGDTIYLPGGIFNTYPTLDKRLVIYGAGIHPDSTVATDETVLSGHLTISANADSLELHGLYITGDINFSYNHKVDFVKIDRCLMSTIYLAGNFSTPCTNLLVKESYIMGDINFTNATNSSVTNCIVGGRVSNGSANAYQNNIFLFNDSYYGYYNINNADNSLFSNNVFTRSLISSIHNGTEFSTFSNNVFGGAAAAGSNTFIGNFMSTPLTTFFLNQTGNTPSFAHDYHLTTPGSFIGLDGSQVGIYGGLYPMKVGNVPVNPHIISKIIAPQTGTTGDLNIQIQVGAQNH